MHLTYATSPHHIQLIHLCIDRNIQVSEIYIYNLKLDYIYILLHMYKEKFFLWEGQLYQERLVFNSLKNNTKMYLENKENAFSAKSFQGPKADPGLQPFKADFIHMILLCSVSKLVRKKMAHCFPKILGPPLYLYGLSAKKYTTGNNKWVHLYRKDPLPGCHSVGLPKTNFLKSLKWPTQTCLDSYNIGGSRGACRIQILSF